MNAGATAIPGQQEKALLDLLGRIGRSSAGRHVLHIKLSQLRPQNRVPKRLHIAALGLEPLINAYEGVFFRLHNDDFVVLCNGATNEAITKAATHIAHLFVGDPGAEPNAAIGAGFWDHYDLSKTYAQFAAAVREMLEAALGSGQDGEVKEPSIPKQAQQRILDSSLLGKIQSAIAQADLTNVIRRQAVCAIVPGGQPQPVFTEVFTSMVNLRDVLTPDIDIYGNPWLFRDLTAHLDRRVISFLGHRDDSTLRKAFSINLNVGSLASNEFLAFDQDLSSEARETIVLELQLIDVLADIDTFFFSRNFLRERKYRFCLDGLTYQTLPLVDCAGFGVDLVKVIWNPELHELAAAKDPALMKAVASIGPKRIILIRCDKELAFETGKLLGSSMYQGYLIDSMLKQAASKPTSAKAAPAKPATAKPAAAKPTA